MPYKTGKFKGELTSGELRKLVREHNKLYTIKIPPKSSRDDIIKLIQKNGYKVDHVNAQLKPTSANITGKKVTRKPSLKLSDVKPTTKKAVAKPTPKPEKKVSPKLILDKVQKLEQKDPTPPKEDFVVDSDRGKLNREFKSKYKKTIYQVLGVKSRASPSEVKKRARELRLKLHPDKGGDTAEFSKVNEAIKIMLDTFKPKKSVAKKSVAKKPVVKPTPKQKKESSVLVDQDLKDEAKLKKETKEEKIMKTPLYKELLKLEKQHIKNLINDRKQAIKKGTTEGMHDKSNAEYEKQEEALRKKYKDTKLPRSLLYIFNKDKVVSKLIKEHDALGKKLPKN
mgnify:CR=1 FL=1